ncbi:MAG TPA: XcyI family restriction endonuclease [Solirubrobacterales bacterium]|nr:XcyI family restriction endonuclease [Solirubrobacterales bacterium]
MAARKTVLIEALREAVGEVAPAAIKEEISSIVPEAAQQLLAQAGIRDEDVFPVPSILRKRPTLIGYYRLLLGSSQKQFYSSGSGLGIFKSMETQGNLSGRADQQLEDFCKAMTLALADLIDQISPRVTQRDVEQLPLLTLGSQFQGSNNNRIGKAATEEVFLAIHEIVAEHISKESSGTIVVKNAAGRDVRIRLAADPDVRFEEEFGAELRPGLAIEIKGGTDRSNAHNRAGEAEKSHQKAKALGYPECWTVIATKGLDVDVLKSDSPTTNLWFDATQILAREGEDWVRFQTRLVGIVGIPG